MPQRFNHPQLEDTDYPQPHHYAATIHSFYAFILESLVDNSVCKTLLCGRWTTCKSVIVDFIEKHGCRLVFTPNVAVAVLHLLRGQFERVISTVNLGEVRMDVDVYNVTLECNADKILEFIVGSVARRATTHYRCEVKCRCVLDKCILSYTCRFPLFNDFINKYVRREWRTKRDFNIVGNHIVEKTLVLSLEDALDKIIELLQMVKCNTTKIYVDAAAYAGHEMFSIEYSVVPGSSRPEMQIKVYSVNPWYTVTLWHEPGKIEIHVLNPDSSETIVIEKTGDDTLFARYTASTGDSGTCTLLP